MKSKVFIVTGLLVVALVALGAYVFSNADYPEKLILGEWKEVHWTYDRHSDNSKVNQQLSEEERENIANHLVVHEFEHWTFSKNRRLKLHEKNGSEHYNKWQLKDRGRILQLVNPDGTKEVYSVESLSDKELVLHFDTDVHARGIVKITLQKI